MPFLPNVGSSWPACAKACAQSISKIQKTNNQAPFDLVPELIACLSFDELPSPTMSTLLARLSPRMHPLVKELSPACQKLHPRAESDIRKSGPQSLLIGCTGLLMKAITLSKNY